ncbi:MAG TPA: patatin-like phospholipase family protein, partial [Myxococcota bacterium]|nr:patatin-like phospholipase family protein [Myxococcota bacterium]
MPKWLRACQTVFLAALCALLLGCGNLESKDQHGRKPDKTNVGTNEEPENDDEGSQTPIKVLSLDGGGVRGVISAHLLAGIEKETGKKTHELFDVIAGTSTGGLIAILLTTPNDKNNGPYMSAEEIEQFYLTKVKELFSSSCGRFVPKQACGLKGPMYDASVLERMINEMVGYQQFGASLTPVLVTAFDIERKQGFTLESDLPNFASLTKLDVARATSAAPTYFSPKLLRIKSSKGGETEHYMVDGGLYKNNPAMLAFRKAEKLFGPNELKRRGVLLISVGTGWPVAQVHDGSELLKAGFLGWAPAIVDAIIDGTSQEDHWSLEELFQLYQRSKYIRIQTILDNINNKDIVEL